MLAARRSATAAAVTPARRLAHLRCAAQLLRVLHAPCSACSPVEFAFVEPCWCTFRARCRAPLRFPQTACGVGYFQSSATASTCTVCPAGSYCPSATTCTPTKCTAGKYGTNTGRSSDCTLGTLLFSRGLSGLPGCSWLWSVCSLPRGRVLPGWDKHANRLFSRQILRISGCVAVPPPVFCLFTSIYFHLCCGAGLTADCTTSTGPLAAVLWHPCVVAAEPVAAAVAPQVAPLVITAQPAHPAQRTVLPVSTATRRA